MNDQQTGFTDGSDRRQHHDDAGRVEMFDNRQQRGDSGRERQFGEHESGGDAFGVGMNGDFLQLRVVPFDEDEEDRLHPFDPANAVANTTAKCRECDAIVPYPYMTSDPEHSLCTKKCYWTYTAKLTAGQPMPEITEASLRLIQITDEKRARAYRNRVHYDRARQKDDELRARLGLPFLDGESHPEAASQSPELLAA